MLGNNQERYRASGAYLIDSNNNRVEIAKAGSKRMATAMLNSLKDCKNCLNCIDCIDCEDCRDSTALDDCIDCKNCRGLIGETSLNYKWEILEKDALAINDW